MEIKKKVTEEYYLTLSRSELELLRVMIGGSSPSLAYSGSIGFLIDSGVSKEDFHDRYMKFYNELSKFCESNDISKNL